MALGIAINVTSLLRPNMIKRNSISVVTGMVVEEIAHSVKYIVRNVGDRVTTQVPKTTIGGLHYTETPRHGC